MKQSGATLLEFIIAAPLVLLVGMGTLQAALIYHANSTLHYATFEAARAGAVNHAQMSVMRETLGIRLAPIVGGDGTKEKALEAVAQSALMAADVTRTQLQILNPTAAAFTDWGQVDQSQQRTVIPNAHLRNKPDVIGQESGLSLRDANLLKIKVTFGVELKVPWVAGMIAKAMSKIDTKSASFYARNQFPLNAVATVRMQSDVWEEEILKGSNTSNPATHSSASSVNRGTTRIPTLSLRDQANDNSNHADAPGSTNGLVDLWDTENPGPADPDYSCETDTPQDDNFGLGDNPVLLQTSDYSATECSEDHPGYSSPVIFDHQSAACVPRQ